ncbi:uncharacterized protein VICG_01808, partial [Vittaforma corneae ATCC 50505]
MEEAYQNTISNRSESLINYLKNFLPITVASTTWESRNLKDGAINHTKTIVDASQNSSICKIDIDADSEGIITEDYLIGCLKDVLSISGEFADAIVSTLLTPFRMLSPVYITLLILSILLFLAIFYIDNSIAFSAVYYAYLSNFSLAICIIFANFSILQKASTISSGELPKGLEFFIRLYPYGWMFCEVFVMLLYCFYFISYILYASTKDYKDEESQAMRRYIRDRRARLSAALLLSLIVSEIYYFICRMAMVWMGSILAGF